jgi:hypothetical protein
MHSPSARASDLPPQLCRSYVQGMHHQSARSPWPSACARSRSAEDRSKGRRRRAARQHHSRRTRDAGTCTSTRSRFIMFPFSADVRQHDGRACELSCSITLPCAGSWSCTDRVPLGVNASLLRRSETRPVPTVQRASAFSRAPLCLAGRRAASLLSLCTGCP